MGTTGSRALADILWRGIRHTPPLPHADGGLRRWYLEGPYAFVVSRRRRRVWAHRSPEPWLTAQWLLDRAGGVGPSREDLRFEGLPGHHSYEAAYRAVAGGQFDRPFVYVAGYGRSGTTSLQNLVLAAFGTHVPPGEWSDPTRPVQLWWYPKHDAEVAARIAALDPRLARVLVCVRPFVASAASLALYRGIREPATLDAAWVDEQIDVWLAMARVAAIPAAVPIAFEWLTGADPNDVAVHLEEVLAISASPQFDRDSTWPQVYAGRISEEELDNPLLGNLPHADRPRLSGRLRERIAELCGPELDRLDDAYAAAIDSVPYDS